ncbi:helix-turn-helix domain-containing protein [Arthrobacter bambusae]|uniref:HTH cro/C1-type domain-containing protein n=1 Tax=Arthrobacter bambusae TaxID=1338426 RepID=A0AAW8DEX5_9MICC|nr:helix-turn-helix transcriptional regulator [Arthrobacter bambusae]MDP9903213.1 hypothetical protein [Arthrobacter bambusae]MDQ0128793.1 hypothetical protein [Arthrobacter bambusae]MDQ0180134.1 hypothetical protein [Arthrobacter bambusae]
MAETLFPVRQRCKKCGKALGRDLATVLFGLYCSPSCAGMAEPSKDAGDSRTPRECKTMREGKWEFKRRYRSVQEIPDLIREDPSTNWYTCGHCGAIHVGHSRLGEAEQFRMVHVQSDIADVLVKRRGLATIAQVAKVAGVRPIRLKELENGVAHPDGMATLLKVAPVLGLSLGFGIRQRRGDGRDVPTRRAGSSVSVSRTRALRP